jgi:hypothetical protein
MDGGSCNNVVIAICGGCLCGDNCSSGGGGVGKSENLSFAKKNEDKNSIC